MRSALLLLATSGGALGELKYTYGRTELDLGWNFEGTIERCDGYNFYGQRPSFGNMLHPCWIKPKPECPNGHWSESSKVHWPPGEDLVVYYSGETCDEWDDFYGNHNVAKWYHYKFDVTCKICPDWATAGPDSCEYPPHLRYVTEQSSGPEDIPPQYQACMYCSEPDEVVQKDAVSGNYTCRHMCNGAQHNLHKRMENAAKKCPTPGGGLPKGIAACKPSSTSSSTPAPTGSSCPMQNREAGCQINDAGLKLAKSYERCAAQRYNIDGDQTIGWGHDCTQKKDCTGPKFKEPMSSETADEIFKADMDVAKTRVTKNVPNLSGLNSNQFSALVDFAFNGGRFQNLLPYMKAKKYTAMCNVMANTTVTSGGKPSRGVKCRREAESALCNTPTKQMSGCP